MPDAQVLQLQTKRGSLIVAALISHHLKERPTILFSHGNAVDLALMLPFYRCACVAMAAHCHATGSQCVLACDLPRTKACYAVSCQRSQQNVAPRAVAFCCDSITSRVPYPPT